MFPRIVAGILLIIALPIMAHASNWTLNTWVRTGGGKIEVNGGAPQSTISGSVFKTYTTSAANPDNAVNVVVTAYTGYSISTVTVNGNQTIAPPSPFSVTVGGPTSQSVWATFKPNWIRLSATAADGGMVTPATFSGIRYGQILHAPVKFKVTPLSGFRVEAIDGIPLGASISQPLPAASDKVVVVTLPRGFRVEGSLALAARFKRTAAYAGGPQTVKVGSLVTLDGSDNPEATSYFWTQISGPGFPDYKVMPDRTSGVKAYIIPQAVGTYRFRLDLDGGRSAYALVIVTDSATKTARTQCQNCHGARSIGGRVKAFSGWSSSAHQRNFVMCSKCHVGVDTGAHPGPGLTSAELLNACNACHVGSAGDVPGHPFKTGATLCVSCHDPHSTKPSMAGVPAVHFNNASSAGYPASYLTSRSSCSDCHIDGSQNVALRRQWEASGHAATLERAWMGYDFKTRSGCVQCHTTTGFIAYSTGRVTEAWGSATDYGKEVLSCRGCHSDILAGTVRNVAPIRPFTDDSYRNRDLGTSNICLSCHCGINNGSSIQVQVGRADFGDLAFVVPHGFSSGGTLQGRSGYHFSGRSYSFYSSNTHRQIGIDNYVGTGQSGPCVSCHVSGTGSHDFQVTRSNVNGDMVGINPVFCKNCHGGTLNVNTLKGKQQSYDNALYVLRTMLADQGILYHTDYPYFRNRDWGGGQVGADTMGAAFNYRLLLDEPGAYVHNAAYAKKLIADSIDVLYNGTVTGSLEPALNYLVGRREITKAMADDLLSYIKGDAENQGNGHQKWEWYLPDSQQDPGSLSQ